METCKICNMYDLRETIAAALFEGATYPWEVLPRIADFIREYGKTLDPAIYEKRGEDIWVAKSATVFESAYLHAPLIIDENAEIRQCAFIRGAAIVGKNAVVGNSTELKNVVLFNNVQVPHYNYVGDSILGYKAHMGAGSITSNVKSDKTLVVVKDRFANEAGQSDKDGKQSTDSTISNHIEKMETGLKKFGAMIGDNVEVGCNTVLNPGTVVGRGSHIYPVSCVRGVIPPNHIYKSETEIVPIR